jgi:serine/threonine protein kinase
MCLLKLGTLAIWIKELQQTVKLACKYILKNFLCEVRTNQQIILISEMISRGTLNSYLKTFKYPRLTVCQSWFNQILEGLAYLHEHGVVHGYVCCDNIYINSNTGELKIGNSCLSKLPEAISNKFVYRIPLDDIRRFGLLALEVALSQLLSPSKLRKNMEKLYELSKFDKKKILKFTKHITDDEYRLFVETCISADSSVSIKDIQQLKFLTSTRGKNETLRGIIKKSTNTKDNKRPNSKFSLIIIQNTLRTSPGLESQLINIQLTIVNPQVSYRIKFDYNLTFDTPEAVAQEMRESLSLPEEYILSVQAQIQAAVQSHINNLRKNIGDYGRTEFKTEIDNRSETTSENFLREQHPGLHSNSRQPSISESISLIDTSSVASICTNNTAIEHMKAFALRYLPSIAPKTVAEREETLQPEVTFSDVQLTPRNEGGEDIDKETHKR